MTINTQQRAQEILHDLENIQYIPAAISREQRLGEINAALDSCIQAFEKAGVTAECLSQLQYLKGKC